MRRLNKGFSGVRETALGRPVFFSSWSDTCGRYSNWSRNNTAFGL